MRLPASFLLTVAFVSTSFGGLTPAHAGEVNLSRLRMTAAMPDGWTSGAPVGFGGPVDPTVLDNFCGDGDGCTVRLQMLGAASEVRGAQRVLFKSGSHWTTEVDVDSVDGDNIIAPFIQLRESPGGVKNGCEFSDVDPLISSSDPVPGLSMLAMYWNAGVPAAGFTCVLTVID